MGRLIMIKCDCGFEKWRYYYGVGFNYFEHKQHMIKLIKAGQFGIQWQELLLSDPDLDVDAEYLLYQCPCCHNIVDETSLDLYKPNGNVHEYFTPDPKDVLYRFKHICPKCRKKMELVPMPKEDKHGEMEEPEVVICPVCGNVATVEFAGWFD